MKIKKIETIENFLLEIPAEEILQNLTFAISYKTKYYHNNRFDSFLFLSGCHSLYIYPCIIREMTAKSGVIPFAKFLQ